MFHLQKTQIEWNRFRRSCDERFEQDRDDRLENDVASAVAQFVRPVQFVKSNDAHRESNLREPPPREQQQLRQAEFRQAQELGLLAS